MLWMVENGTWPACRATNSVMDGASLAEVQASGKPSKDTHLTKIIHFSAFTLNSTSAGETAGSPSCYQPFITEFRPQKNRAIRLKFNRRVQSRQLPIHSFRILSQMLFDFHNPSPHDGRPQCPPSTRSDQNAEQGGLR